MLLVNNKQKALLISDTEVTLFIISSSSFNTLQFNISKCRSLQRSASLLNNFTFYFINIVLRTLEEKFLVASL